MIIQHRKRLLRLLFWSSYAAIIVTLFFLLYPLVAR